MGIDIKESKKVIGLSSIYGLKVYETNKYSNIYITDYDILRKGVLDGVESRDLKVRDILYLFSVNSTTIKSNLVDYVGVIKELDINIFRDINKLRKVILEFGMRYGIEK